MTAATLLAVMAALTPWHGDRGDTPGERRALLAPVAEAQHAACSEPPALFTPTTCNAALLALAQHETHLARYVLEGRCQDGPRGQRCDWDRRTNRPRARGAYQLWQASCPEAWRHPAGSHESMRIEARCALRRLTGAYYRCRSRHRAGDLAGMFAGYRSIDCRWAPAAKRVRTMQIMQLRLEAAERST